MSENGKKTTQPEDEKNDRAVAAPGMVYRRHNVWIWGLVLLVIIGYALIQATVLNGNRPQHTHQPPPPEPTVDTSATPKNLDEITFDGQPGSKPKQPSKPEEEKPDMTSEATETAAKAILHTSMGDITVEFFADDAPKTVSNFVKLSKKGFYDGLIFHRVIKEFMIQGGCPQGTGTGGPGYTFEDEFNDHKIVAGTLAMANSGPNTNGSQFFIVTESPQSHLDGKHTAFGQVEKGMDVVKKIAAVKTGPMDRPLEPVTIESVEIVD